MGGKQGKPSALIAESNPRGIKRVEPVKLIYILVFNKVEYFMLDGALWKQTF
jgi:hypothetical protein